MRKLATADQMLGEGKDVADVCRELQVSEQTYYRWRNQFGGCRTMVLAARSCLKCAVAYRNTSPDLLK